MTEEQAMNVEYHNSGYVLNVGRRLAPCRSFTVNAYNGQRYLHINDSSKCYDD